MGSVKTLLEEGFHKCCHALKGLCRCIYLKAGERMKGGEEEGEGRDEGRGGRRGGEGEGEGEKQRPREIRNLRLLFQVKFYL